MSACLEKIVSISGQVAAELPARRLDRPTTCLENVVAVPVCNEFERIVDCLDALAVQADIAAGALGLLLFLNNCTDGTRDVVETWIPTCPWPVRLVEEDSAAASAGWARRKAMDAGAAWLEAAGSPAGLILTTDADSRVAIDWVARNRAAMTAGADAVAGRFVFDPIEAASLPIGLQRRQKLEAEYEGVLAEIAARLAPQRGNPWPCHRTGSGASIAVSLSAYRLVSGMPALRSGEDRAFLDLLRSRNLIVRHATDIVVTTSSRLDGRASGGTADTLRRWRDDPDGMCEVGLQRLGGFVLSLFLRQPIGAGRTRRPLRPRELRHQIARAALLLKLLRLLDTDQGGRRRPASLRPGSPKRLSMP